ncbi:MAG: zinc ribbon domain-containing protein [Anaerolineales bacterium]|jgi:putative FmdB family regulatory protein|nr:zinc ribbon domain-containing protein [Anaerolineales bacterium]
MPVYTYRCESCGVHFDRQQKFSDQPLGRCPECGKKSLHKVYAPVGILFKGSGFYATDHRSPSGQTRNGIKRDEGKDESKGDSKAASKETTQVKNSESGE